MMMPLADAVQQLALVGTFTASGYWFRMPAACCTMYVAQGMHHSLMWCDHPQVHAVERYNDPIAALTAGLRRAEQCATAYCADT